MTIVVQSGASRQDHQNKERNTTKQRQIPLQKKQKTAVQSPGKYYFPISNRQSSKIITAYV